MNSPNVGHLKLFHLETMQWYLLLFFFFPGKNAEIAGTAIFFRETYVSCLSGSIRLGLGVELGAVFFILCVCVHV